MAYVLYAAHALFIFHTAFISSLTFIYERTLLDTINYANPINLYVYNLRAECASFETLLFYIRFGVTQQILFLNRNLF